MPAARRRSAIGALVTLVLSFAVSACDPYDALESVVGDVDLCGGAGPVARVQLFPAQVTLRSGDSVEVYLSELDARGRSRLFCGGPPPSWASMDTTIAVVRDRGHIATVLAVNPGTTTLRGQVPPGVFGTTAVTVVPR